MSILIAIIAAIILFSLLIFVHELGHFLAAKLSGVQVNEFSMFMGPAIVKWQRGETQYSIRCIPIGGYCAMEGEDEDTDNPRSFQKAAWWKRLIILVAGAAMNFVTGLLIFGILIMPRDTVLEPVISQFEECCIFNNEHALQVGDRIIALDGEKIYVYSDVSLLLELNPAQSHDIVVERNGERLEFTNLMMAHTHTDDAGQIYQHYGFHFGSEKPATFWDNLAFTWNFTLDNVRSVRLSLQMLFTGKAGVQDVSGPVGIVQIMSNVAAESETVKMAISSMLSFGGMIAVNLAVMNLLPIPALDGGRVVGLLLTTAAEKITGKKLNSKIEGYIHGIGMILLLILMGLVMFKDIFAIFKR